MARAEIIEGAIMVNPDVKGQGSSASDPNPIQRIAEIFNVPVKNFLPSDMTDPTLQALNDTAELIRLIAQIDDQRVRRRCIAFVRAAADGRDPSSALGGDPM